MGFKLPSTSCPTSSPDVPGFFTTKTTPLVLVAPAAGAASAVAAAPATVPAAAVPLALAAVPLTLAAVPLTPAAVPLAPVAGRVAPTMAPGVAAAPAAVAAAGAPAAAGVAAGAPPTAGAGGTTATAGACLLNLIKSRLLFLLEAGAAAGGAFSAESLLHASVIGCDAMCVGIRV